MYLQFTLDTYFSSAARYLERAFPSTSVDFMNRFVKIKDFYCVALYMFLKYDDELLIQKNY